MLCCHLPAPPQVGCCKAPVSAWNGVPGVSIAVFRLVFHTICLSLPLPCMATRRASTSTSSILE